MSDAEPRFNLIDEPWILAEDPAGKASEYSIQDIFHQASELTRLRGDVPTQAFAILRMLLAILYRAVDVTSADEWAELWASEELPLGRIDDYLGRFHDRFFLVHPKQPFYQVADLHTAKNEMTELGRLIADVPNGQPFFTTRSGSGVDTLSFAEATRWLVHCQAFDISGIKSGAVGDARVKGGKGYPIGQGWAGYLGGLYAEGGCLRETLLLNLTLPIEETGLEIEADDVPIWERAPLSAGVERRTGSAPTGPCDLFTWPSRRMRLGISGDVVTSVLICNGDRITPQNMFTREPLSGWRFSEPQTKKAKTVTYMPREHDPARSMWRGMAALLAEAVPSFTNKNVPRFRSAALLESLEIMRDEGALPDEQVVKLHASGISYGTQNASIDEIVDDSLSFAVALLKRADTSGTLAQLAVTAVEIADGAVQLLAKLGSDLDRARGGDGSSGRTQLIDATYAELDRPFRQWLLALGPDTVLLEAGQRWQRTVRGLVLRLEHELMSQIGSAELLGRSVRSGSGTVLVNAPVAEARFLAGLRKLLTAAYAPDIVPPHLHAPQEMNA